MSAAARGCATFSDQERTNEADSRCLRGGRPLAPARVLAASPAGRAAIKTIEAVGADAGKLKLFCELNRLLQAHGDKEDPGDAEADRRTSSARIGPDFAAAWDIGDELDENSPDGQEFYAAVDALAEKCT